MFLYRMYKTDHKFEKYFDIIDGKLLRSFVNFRMCDNVVPIETGRWLRNKQVPFNTKRAIFLLLLIRAGEYTLTEFMSKLWMQCKR